MPDQVSLTPQQLRIMEALWSLDRGTVTDVREALLPEKPLAPTTVATVLKRLEKRGIVTHRLNGRQYVYEPNIRREDIRESTIRDVVRRVFHGSPKDLVNHLVHDTEVDTRELNEMRAMIERELARRNGNDEERAP